MNIQINTVAGKGRTHELSLETHSRVEFCDVTAPVQKLVAESHVESGLCCLFVPHTSAALLINENDDPGLRSDVDEFLKRLAPGDHEYHHNDGNCDAHLKASLLGGSKTLLVEDGRLLLGQWQGIYFCEFDGPRRRKVFVKIVAG